MLKFSSGVLTAVVIVAAIATAFAEQPSTPPAQAASALSPARIQTPANGDVVTSPFKVQIAHNPKPGVAPASADQGSAGHHVLLIDTTLSDQDMSHPIKADAQHILFRRDQIAALITLPPGRHTLQFVVAGASDIPFKPLAQSQAITVTVGDPGATTAAPNTEGKEAEKAKAAEEARKATEAQQAQEARAAQAAKEEAEARLAQEAKAAQAAREAAEAKLAQEAKAAQAAREALEASQAQEARAKAAEQALAAKEAEQALKALDARQALEDAKQARDAQQALDARLAKEEEESRLALAKQAREARLATEARQAAETSPGKANTKATAHLGVRHAKAGRARSARTDLNRAGRNRAGLKLAHLNMLPIVLHPEVREVQWRPRLHQGHHHHRAHAYAHRQHRVQVHRHKRHRNHGNHHCQPRHYYHFNQASSE